MLTEIYIEALLVDEELADQVWQASDKGEIEDSVAIWVWWTVAQRLLYPRKRPVRSASVDASELPLCPQKRSFRW